MKPISEMSPTERAFWTAAEELDADALAKIVQKDGSVVDLFREVQKTGSSFLDRRFIDAAKTNNTRMMEVLADLKADIHAKGDRALDLASQEGATNAVIWLLDHGANAEDTKFGKFALRSACSNGHPNAAEAILQTYKKVVGASDADDLRSRTTSQEVLDLLDKYAGPSEQGAKAKGPDAEAQKSSIVEYFEKRYGKSHEFVVQQIVKTGIPVSVHVIANEYESDYMFLFTTGMSAFEMKAPDGKLKRAELFTCRPFKAHDELDFKANSWIIPWLIRLAQYPHQSGEWIGPPLTFFSPDPQEKFVPGRDFTGFVTIPDDTMVNEDGHEVQIMLALPVFQEEIAYEKKHGALKFLQLFQEKGIPTFIDNDRKNAAKR